MVCIAGGLYEQLTDLRLKFEGSPQRQDDLL